MEPLEGDPHRGKRITPDDLLITPQQGKPTYHEFAARYHTIGLTPPPASQIIAVVAKQDDVKSESAKGTGIWFEHVSTATVSTGYKAVSWAASVLSWQNSAIGTHGSVRIAVGSGSSTHAEMGQGQALETTLSGAVGGITTGAVPVAIRTNEAVGFVINVTIACVPLDETIKEWQQKTYDQILSAYWALRRLHEEELEARAMSQGVAIEGTSPVRNKEVVAEELKRQVIELLMGTDFLGRKAMTPGTSEKPPENDLGSAAQVASEIQFMEQAFEWENMTYIFYPYFWSDHNRWAELATLSSTDPEFQRFLAAGPARVIVPARPFFEDDVQAYLNWGVLWGGGPAPSPEEENYLSIAQEIKAQQQMSDKGIPGESWEVRLPTTLVWLENDLGLPSNKKPKLDAPAETLIVDTLPSA
jgi:hypothetical protein